MSSIGVKQQLRKPRGTVLSTGLYPVPGGPVGSITVASVSGIRSRIAVVTHPYPLEKTGTTARIGGIRNRSVIVPYSHQDPICATTSAEVVEVRVRSVVVEHPYGEPEGSHTSSVVSRVSSKEVVIPQSYDTEASTTFAHIIDIRKEIV